MSDRPGFATRAIHSFHPTEDPHGGVAPAIQLSTTYARDEAGMPLDRFTYIRESNPNEAQLESVLAVIESGDAALAFSSGMAACAAFFQALPAGSHVVLPDDCYYAVRLLGKEFFPRWQLTAEFVDMSDLDALRRAMRRGCTVWAETPSNPLLKICDLRAIAQIAAEFDALFAVDNTFATPVLQRPLELGAHVVMHSTTKYLGGHSDVHGGALILRGREENLEAVRHVRHVTGGVGSPFAHWLVARGIRTLEARMRVHCENARKVAEFLAAHHAVESVFVGGGR